MNRRTLLSLRYFQLSGRVIDQRKLVLCSSESFHTVVVFPPPLLYALSKRPVSQLVRWSSAEFADHLNECSCVHAIEKFSCNVTHVNMLLHRSRSTTLGAAVTFFRA